MCWATASGSASATRGRTMAQEKTATCRRSAPPRRSKIQPWKKSEAAVGGAAQSATPRRGAPARDTCDIGFLSPGSGSTPKFREGKDEVLRPVNHWLTGMIRELAQCVVNGFAVV